MKKIAFISQPEYFRFIYENDLDDTFEVREFPFHYGMEADQFEDLISFGADYNFFFRGEFFPEDTLKKMTGVKINLSSEPFPRRIDGKWEYTRDSIERYYAFREIKNKSFDYVFHYDISSREFFEKDGLLLSGEFTFPVSQAVYCPVEKEKKWDIFFIGRSTPHREKFFGSLKHHFNFLHIAHGVHGEELVEYMRKSVICINAHAEDEVSWEPRMQMMLSSGAFVLSERITPNRYLRPGKEFVEYSTPEDLFEKVRFYLDHAEDRMRVQKNARERVEKFFCTKKRFVELIENIEKGNVQKFSVKSGNNLLKIFFKCISLWKKVKKIL